MRRIDFEDAYPYQKGDCEPTCCECGRRNGAAVEMLPVPARAFCADCLERALNMIGGPALGGAHPLDDETLRAYQTDRDAAIATAQNLRNEIDGPLADTIARLAARVERLKKRLRACADAALESDEDPPR